MRPDRIRNFAIIAHIDHGKSTLSDQFLLQTGAISERGFRAQVLDDMDLERERGITIKAHPVSIMHTYKGEEYLLNLIDTPGHVDFAYEVSRSLAACEGSLLLADASQGIEAQTLANAYLAIESNHEIIPVISKIDLPAAITDIVSEEFCDFLGCAPADIHLTSGKTGIGVPELLDAICEKIPAPAGTTDAPPRALIFDSEYDDYRGVIAYIRMVDGTLNKGDKIRMLATGREYEITDMGVFRPKMTQVKNLSVGEVGYLVAAIKNIEDVRVGDTITTALHGTQDPLPGYEQPQPMVYCGLYPSAQETYENLRHALDRLKLNDSSLQFEPETSAALGLGFRCGFLGLLHMEIVQERLERESNLDLVQTAPTVTYQILLTNGNTLNVHSPSDVPDPTYIKEFREPIAKVQIMVPKEYIGTVMCLVEDRRSIHGPIEYLGGRRALLHFEMPLSEIVYDFYDKLKSATRGYGTLDYEFFEYREAQLSKVDILVHGQPVDALSMVLPREVADKRARKILIRLRQEIPRHLFQVALQAAIGGKVIARENISALSKNVTAKCYGGDITRKRKLLENQKEGKKRMKSIGSVSVPQEAFFAVLSREDD